MKSKLHKQAANAIKQWCEANNTPAIGAIRHVHPRVLVIGKAAPKCLVVSVPWQDSEPQCRTFDEHYPLSLIYVFDDALKAGDWCATGYVCFANSQESVAVRMEC